MTINWDKPIEYKSLSLDWVPATVLRTNLKHPTLNVAFTYNNAFGHEVIGTCNRDGRIGIYTCVRNKPETKTVYQTLLEKKKTTSITTSFKPELRVGDDGKNIGHPGWKVTRINELQITQAAA